MTKSPLFISLSVLALSFSGFVFAKGSSSAEQAVCEVTSLKEAPPCKNGDILLYQPNQSEQITWKRMQLIFPWDIAALYCDFDKTILDREKLVCVVKKKPNAEEIFSKKVNSNNN